MKMKAQVISEFGDPSVFQLTEVEKPQPIPHHVVIKVHATSVNQIDCKIRSGAVTSIAPELPAILHGDVAGVIESVGEGVTKFKPGDEVYGCAGGVRACGGALAEYMLADSKLIAKKPKTLSMGDAAALPLVAITAWEALFLKTILQKNQRVLIHGGLGGVGHIAVQLAKWSGAHVFTTVMKNEDFEEAKLLGADEVINAKNETAENYKDRLTQGDGFDFIFDTVGGANLNNSFLAATWNGVIVTTAARATLDLTLMHNKGLTLSLVFMLLPLLLNKGREQHGQILDQIAALVDDGKLKPLIDQHNFTLDTVSQAHAFLESGQAKGKVLITNSENFSGL